jgi:glyoxylase-like metal-dependent hydrolase (beta-lactamase superfamily II)
MLFRQLFGYPGGRDHRPVLEQLDRDLGLLSDLGLALDTQVHADHVTASGALRNRLGARTLLSERAGVGCAGDLLKDGGDASGPAARDQLRSCRWNRRSLPQLMGTRARSTRPRSPPSELRE